MLAAALLVGGLALHPCADAAGFWCGTLSRPLDPARRVPGTVRVAFRWLPRTQSRGSPDGTIVAAEGGPGYPSGGSRDAYRVLFGPLLANRNLLLMDNRGTGGSDVIDCLQVQRGAMTPSGIARCGAQLGSRFALYGTGLATDDLDALLQALKIDAVDLYGDSYGTFFAQAFAARHPARVRSLMLDGAFPPVGEDPWYPSASPTIIAAFDHVCRRSEVCAALPGSTLDRVQHLLAVLRARTGTVTPSDLAFVMDSAGLDPLVYRELDAAGRAYVANDVVALQRLVRETRQYEEAPPADPRVLSNGLFLAVSCADYPQAYDMRLTPLARHSAWQATLAAKKRDDPALYAPFTIDEYLAMPLDYAYVPLCLSWPAATADYPPESAVPDGARMPDVPALVLTGDLDTITTPAEGDAAAAQFRNARRIVVINTGHVSAVGDVYHCASEIVRRFVLRQPSNDDCVSRIPPIRLVPEFDRTASTVAPATSSLPHASERALRLSADAVYAADDALSRMLTLGIAHGTGLRGGTFTSKNEGDVTRLFLHGVKWTQDLAVSGTVTMRVSNGDVNAQLVWPRSIVRAVWNAYQTQQPRLLEGTVDANRVRAKMSN